MMREREREEDGGNDEGERKMEKMTEEEKSRWEQVINTSVASKVSD